MEDTDIDKVVKSNFPALDVHAGYIKRLTAIATDIQTEKAIYRNKIKPLLGDRDEVYKEARQNGVDTKALKQLKLVVDFIDKNIINVHDKIGEDAGDTAMAMFEQFSLPLPDVAAGKDLVAEAERVHAEKEKARKADAKKAKKADKKPPAKTGTQHPDSDAVKAIKEKAGAT